MANQLHGQPLDFWGRTRRKSCAMGMSLYNQRFQKQQAYKSVVFSAHKMNHTPSMTSTTKTDDVVLEDQIS